MQLKSRDEIQAALNAIRGQHGFAAAADDAAERVMALCAPLPELFGGVSAIPIAVIITLALQILPIIFGEGGFTIEKLQAVLQLILSIFTT